MSGIQPTPYKTGHRIVILCGPKLYHRNTCATLIAKGLNVAGICIADQRTSGLPLRYFLKSCKQKGFGITLSRVLARLAYKSFNARKDREIFARLFDETSINRTLQQWGGEFHYTRNYSSPETIAWLHEKAPDIMVAHTPYWIGKAVRNIPRLKLVIGGHPGITPAYRGSHSSFWALYKGKPDEVGYTVFLIDGGVDTGDILAQGRIPVDSGDSFITLGWKGMIRIAERQAELLHDFDRGVALPRRPASAPPPHSEFDNPTLGQFFRYRLIQHHAR